MVIHEFGIDTFSNLMNIAGNFINELGKNKVQKNTGGSLRRSSIMSASKDLIMSFPVLCSDTLTPSTAAMITKAIERNCVTTLQLLLTAANVRGENGMEVLKQWHNNMDDDYGMDDYLDMIDTVSDYKNWMGEAGEIPGHIIQEFADAVKEIEEFYPVSSFAESSISNFEIVSRNDMDTVKRIPLTEAIRKNKDFQQSQLFSSEKYWDPYSSSFDSSTNAKQTDINYQYTKLMDDRESNATKNAMDKKKFEYQVNKDNADRASRERSERLNRIQQLKSDRVADEYRRERDAIEDEYRRQRDDVKDTLDQERLGIERSKNELDRDKFNLDVKKMDFDQARASANDQLDFFHKQLLDNDVKKCNELVPSLLIVRYQSIDATNKRAGFDQQFIAGVKARLIAVSSEDIISHITVSNSNKVNLVNFIRATTGEIRFAKDFIAGIDQAKIEAKQNSKLSKSNPIWRSLQYRSNKSVLNRIFRKNKANDAAAITTLVLSQEEVNFMKKEYKLDLSNPAKAKFILEQFNLMGLVIVDEEIEVARFLYDGEKYFQDYSFNVLERETGDNGYKKVVNLISKINR